MRTMNICLVPVIFIIVLAIIPPAGAMVNPSAGYCSALGYTFSVKPDAHGNEVGYCTLATGETVPAWKFLRGEIATESSYCAKHGLAQKIVNDTRACGILGQRTCAACVFANGSSMEVTAAMGLDFRETLCTADGCHDPKDSPVTPYLIPPAGGARGSGAISPLMLALGAVIVTAILAGAFLVTRRKPQEK
jgi:putative hemolysin